MERRGKRPPVEGPGAWAKLEPPRLCSWILAEVGFGSRSYLELARRWLPGQLQPMNLAIVCVGAVGAGYSAYRMFGFYERLDDALKYLHEAHPEVWEAIGRPVGRLWSPKGASSFSLPGPTGWLNWVEGQEPEWLQRLDAVARSKVDSLRRAKRALPVAAGMFVGGSLIGFVGLVVG